jgi:hypothetical protein
MPKPRHHIGDPNPEQSADDDPYGLIRDDVAESISECDRFFESLKAEIKALKPLPDRPRSPEPPPEEPELSPDAKAVSTMLALGNQRIGRPANAFYAEALEYMTRSAMCPFCGAPKPVTKPVTKAPSALDRAKAAIEAAPEKSNRCIAEEIGVAEGTVRKARKDYAPDYAPASRVGRDGKRYPAETVERRIEPVAEIRLA